MGELSHAGKELEAPGAAWADGAQEPSLLQGRGPDEGERLSPEAFILFLAKEGLSSNCQQVTTSGGY